MCFLLLRRWVTLALEDRGGYRPKSGSSSISGALNHISGNAGAGTPDRCSEEKAEPKGEALNLLVCVYVLTLTCGHELWVVTNRINEAK